MTDLADSFCERCGTRYSFAPPAPKRSLKGARVLAHAAKHFVLSDSTSVNDALTLARGDVDRDTMTQMTEAFHKTFNFCMECRQYTCSSCWNETAGACISCVPREGEEAPVDEDRLVARLAMAVETQPAPAFVPVPPLAQEPVTDLPAWPRVDLEQPPLPAGGNGRYHPDEDDSEWIGASEVVEPEPAVAEPAVAEVALVEPEPLVEAVAESGPAAVHPVVVQEEAFENVAVDRWWEQPFAAVEPEKTAPPEPIEATVEAAEPEAAAPAPPARDPWEGLTIAESWGKESVDLSLTPEELAIVAAQLEHQAHPTPEPAVAAQLEEPAAVVAEPAAEPAEEALAAVAETAEVPVAAEAVVAADVPLAPEPAAPQPIVEQVPAEGTSLLDEATALEAWAHAALAQRHASVTSDAVVKAEAEGAEPELEVVEQESQAPALEAAAAFEAVPEPEPAAAPAEHVAPEPHRPSLISRILKREHANVPAVAPVAPAAEVATAGVVPAAETAQAPEPDATPRWPEATPWHLRPVAARSPFAAEAEEVAEPEPEPVAAAEAEPEPVVAVEPELVVVAAEPEPVVFAAETEPEPVFAVEPEPEPVVVAAEPEPVVAAEPEPVAAAEAELVVATEPEPAVVAEPEPVVAAAEPEPEPAVAAAEPEPEPAVVAPEPEPAGPALPLAAAPTAPAPVADAPVARPAAPVPAAHPQPAWPPLGASWPRPQDPVPTPAWPPAVGAPQPAPWARTAQSTPSVQPPARPAAWVAPEGTPEVWIESAAQVMRPATAVRACAKCALPLSPSARFCRRCGTAQELPVAAGPQAR